MKPLESSVESSVVESLDLAGCIVLKVGYDGWPDRLVLTGDGEHYWIEFKRPGITKLRKAQEIRKRQLEAVGDTVKVINKR